MNDQTTHHLPPTSASVCIAHDDIWRGGRLVIRAGTLDLPCPSVVGLIGANGAGKTTLLHSIAHVLGPKGRVRVTVDGRPHATALLVPQQPALAPWLTLDELFDLAGARRAPVARALAAELDLQPLLPVRAGRYSAGQRQAVALLGALAIGDPLMLLDEPLAHLDTRTRAVLTRRIRASVAVGVGAVTIISSHSVAELAELCDWVVALDNGHYSFSGPTTALLGTVPGTGQPGTLPVTPGYTTKL